MMVFAMVNESRKQKRRRKREYAPFCYMLIEKAVTPVRIVWAHSDSKKAEV